MKEIILHFLSELTIRVSGSYRKIVTCVLISYAFIYLSFYTSIQNFNEIQKQWEKYNNNPGDMKYSSLYWQYPICTNNLVYQLGVSMLSSHDQIIQAKSCIVIKYCYENSLGKGGTDLVDCSEESDAIKIAIASI